MALFINCSCCKKDIVPLIETGEVFDVEGNIYKTIKIGDQWWMAENLKSTKFNDGSLIPMTLSGSNPNYCWYNNDSSTYKKTYGALYNWYTVNNGNLCPVGWHIPNNNEWTTLTKYLGGLNTAGGMLKESGMDHWISPNTGANNHSGFTALPGGLGYDNGNFEYIGSCGQWWSSTRDTLTSFPLPLAYRRDIWAFSNSVFVGSGVLTARLSIRCLKD